MNLRKVKPEEAKIRKALLQDLQAQVKQAHIKVVGKHVGALRAPPKSEVAEEAAEEAAEGEAPAKDGPSDLEAVDAVDVPSVEHDETEEGAESHEAPEGDEKPGRQSLSDMIAALQKK